MFIIYIMSEHEEYMPPNIIISTISIQKDNEHIPIKNDTDKKKS